MISKKHLSSNETIIDITSNAILYFKQCDFETLKNEASGIKYTDIYGEAISKYPLAWEILKKAALMKNEELIFEKTQKNDSLMIDDEFDKSGCRIVVCDGYSLEFDDYLKEELGKVVTGMVNGERIYLIIYETERVRLHN